MTTMQSYYASGDLDSLHRGSSHRSLSTGGYYDRQMPYGYYDQPRQDLRSDYGGRPLLRTVIHELENEGSSGSARRRIAVACSRCRRRKIKCSGDPLNGTGCQACRTSGTDVSACNFIRVGSSEMAMPSVEAYPQASTSAPTQTGVYSAGTERREWPPTGHHHQPQHRPSLPMLHSRGSLIDGYDHYENSPIEAYTYGSGAMPRQDSFASAYGGLENYRSWSTSNGPAPHPVSSSYFEPQQTAYNFGALQTSQAPGYSHAANARLPSVTAGDSLSALNNMGSLHSSLPTQTVQNERRLPVPYTVHYPQSSASGDQLPVIRPLEPSNESRVHIHGVHSRNAMPWSQDNSNSFRAPTTNSLALPHGLPTQHAAGSEPSFGYQFSSLAPAGSPELSPTSTSRHESSATYRCDPASQLPSVTSLDQRAPAAYAEAAEANLYSFSTERPATSSSDHTASDSTGATVDGNYASLHHTQPQHPASVEALQRQSSFDQQQRSSTAHRMSVSNLNGRY